MPPILFGWTERTDPKKAHSSYHTTHSPLNKYAVGTSSRMVKTLLCIDVNSLDTKEMLSTNRKKTYQFLHLFVLEFFFSLNAMHAPQVLLLYLSGLIKEGLKMLDLLFTEKISSRGQYGTADNQWPGLKLITNYQKTPSVFSL